MRDTKHHLSPLNMKCELREAVATVFGGSELTLASQQVQHQLLILRQ